MKIETMSDEFKASLPERAQRYIDRGLSTGDVDREKMQDAVRRVYKAAGLDEPKIFVWMESPYQGCIAAWWLIKLLEELAKTDQVMDQVRNQVWGQVLNNTMYGGWEAGWISHFATLVELGARLDENYQSWLEAMDELVECGWWFPYRGAVVMTGRPRGILHLDPQGRLHNSKGPAIQWKDGYKLYYFHGTRVSEEIIEHPELITVKAIMKETNSEVRRCMCEIMGWDNYVREAKLKLVDECDDPANAPHKLRLYDVPEQVFDVPVRLLLMVNATPKRDGVVPLYGETVPKECKTALGAAAWQIDVSEEVYARMARAS